MRAPVTAPRAPGVTAPRASVAAAPAAALAPPAAAALRSTSMHAEETRLGNKRRKADEEATHVLLSDGLQPQGVRCLFALA